MQLDTLWTQLTEVERDAGRTCAPDLRVDGTGPQACAYLIRAPVPRTPAEQHRSLMETLLALRAAEGGIAETQEEEILVRLDELWGQLTEAERDVEWGSVWPTKPEDK